MNSPNNKGTKPSKALASSDGNSASSTNSAKISSGGNSASSTNSAKISSGGNSASSTNSAKISSGGNSARITSNRGASLLKRKLSRRPNNSGDTNSVTSNSTSGARRYEDDFLPKIQLRRFVSDASLETLEDMAYCRFVRGPSYINDEGEEADEGPIIRIVRIFEGCTGGDVVAFRDKFGCHYIKVVNCPDFKVGGSCLKCHKIRYPNYPQESNIEDISETEIAKGQLCKAGFIDVLNRYYKLKNKSKK